MALRRIDIEEQIVAEAAASSDVSAQAADAALVRAFQHGDPLAFPAIYERYRPLARHIAQRILRNPEDADETSQETMLRVYRGLATFEGELRLQAWVARIAANLSLDALRARGRRPARTDETLEEVARHLPDPAQDPAALVARMLEDAEVRRVLATLPPHHRDALVMREFEGRSHAEIGEVLGVSAPQAKALIHRAKGSFRRAWATTAHGMAAVVPFFLAPLKRLGSHAAELAHGAQAAAPTLTLVPTATQVVASSPALTERLAAAGMAVILAAGIGAGAVAVRSEASRPGSERDVALPAAVAPAAVDPEEAKADAVEAITGLAPEAEAPATTAPADPSDGTEVSAPAAEVVPVIADLPTAPFVLSGAELPLCEGCTVAWGMLVTGAEGSAEAGDLRVDASVPGTVLGPDGLAVEGWSVRAEVQAILLGGSDIATVRLMLTGPDGAAGWAGTVPLERLASGALGFGGVVPEAGAYWSDGSSPILSGTLWLAPGGGAIEALSLALA